MICENCSKEHDGSYGSGRFCSKSCRQTYATKARRIEINEKIRNTLSKAGKRKSSWLNLTNEQRKKGVETRKRKLQNSYEAMSFDELPVIQKFIRVKNEQNSKCAYCKLDQWMNQKLTLEIHHIDGNDTNNKRDNLVYLCPNCHSQTKFFRLQKRLR